MLVKLLVLLVVLQCAQAALKLKMERKDGKGMKLMKEGGFS
jgi:hypothetical protein